MFQIVLHSTDQQMNDNLKIIIFNETISI